MDQDRTDHKLRRAGCFLIESWDCRRAVEAPQSKIHETGRKLEKLRSGDVLNNGMIQNRRENIDEIDEIGGLPLQKDDSQDRGNGNSAIGWLGGSVGVIVVAWTGRADSDGRVGFFKPPRQAARGDKAH